MAWIVPIPPSARHPYERYQVCYHITLCELDASTIGAWKAAMVAEGLRPRIVNTYLSLLGTILNAAVDDDYLPRSPLLRKSGAGRAAATATSRCAAGRCDSPAPSSTV